jgi:ubiquitin C-terminal hydrolase
MDFKEYVKNDNPHIDAHYNLRGIVIHSGTSEAGHYYSLIKTEKDGWMKFNDQNVTSYNENEIDR